MILIFIIFFKILIIDGYPEIAEKPKEFVGRTRTGRFEELNEICTTQTGTNGLCMKRLDCMVNGGTAVGFCGTFGVCCEMNLQCGKISKLKKTIIQSPSYLPRQCAYHFQPFSSNVCQLKVEFDMVLAQPTLPNDTTVDDIRGITCLLDKFEVDNFKICGANLNQHIYLTFDAANGITDLALTFTLADRSQNPSLPGYWRMIVTQLECPSVKTTTARKSTFSLFGFTKPNSLQDLKSYFKPPIEDLDLIAPPGCLQYFTERHGTFESFNYNNGAGPYIANMRYGICFKRLSFDKGVQLYADFFEIGAESDSNNFIDSDCHDSTGTPGRSNDYLGIPESILATTPAALYGTYYCGTSLRGNELLHAPPGPFAIYFNSDNMMSTLVPETGFKISYTIL